MATITDAAIRSAIRSVRTGGKPITLKDPGPRGAGRLALQVRPANGAPTAEWYAIYYRQGRRQLTKLGTYPSTPLAAARELFSSDYEPAIIAGQDPRAAVREASRQRASAGTVKALFEAYVEHLKANGRKTWQEYERALLTMSYAAARTLGEDRAAADVTTADVAALLGEMYRRGARSHADHMRAYMHAAFGWGLKADNDYRQHSRDGVRWGLASNPVSGIPRDTHATAVGDRYLSPDELKAFWRWLADQNSHAARVLQLLIATGQRVQMLTLIGPGYFDAEERLLTWEAEDTKNGKPHVLPLPAKAVDLIAGLTISQSQTRYFPQLRNPQKVVTHFTVADLCRAYCAQPEYQGEPFTPRDLRRTWKTLAGLAGIPKEMRDRLQHHAMSDVGSRHYDRYDYLAEKREAMDQWSAWLDQLLDR